MRESSGLFIKNDRGAFDPFASRLAAHIAWYQSHPGVVSNSLNLARIGERVYVKHAVFFSKPYRSVNRHAILPKCLEVEVILSGKLFERRIGV